MFTILVSLITLLARIAPMSPVPDTASLVTTLGRDTMAVERYERTPARLQGDIVLRAPRTGLYHYVIDFRADGGLARSVLDFSVPGMRNGPRIRTTIIVTGDTAQITVDSSHVLHTFARAVAPNVMPALMTGFGSDYGLYISFGMYQTIAATLPPALDAVTDVPVIDAATGDLRTKHLVRRSATDVDVDYFRIAWTHLTTDANGRIVSADASGTTEKTHSARTGSVNIASTVTAFEQRDRAGESIGVLSPARVATGQIGSASVIVQYSSPRKRGRVILGTTVPFDQVWRTGANAATQLVVDHPLTIGRATIPAGMYTLWTIPGPNSAALIINAQHGQWGTDYDSTRDVARVPMDVKRGQPVQEDFTISIAGSGSTGELRLAWDDFVWTVALSGH